MKLTWQKFDTFLAGESSLAYQARFDGGRLTINRYKVPRASHPFDRGFQHYQGVFYNISFYKDDELVEIKGTVKKLSDAKKIAQDWATNKKHTA